MINYLSPALPAKTSRFLLFFRRPAIFHFVFLCFLFPTTLHFVFLCFLFPLRCLSLALLLQICQLGLDLLLLSAQRTNARRGEPRFSFCWGAGFWAGRRHVGWRGAVGAGGDASWYVKEWH